MQGGRFGHSGIQRLLMRLEMQALAPAVALPEVSAEQERRNGVHEIGEVEHSISPGRRVFAKKSCVVDHKLQFLQLALRCSASVNGDGMDIGAEPVTIPRS